MPAKPKRIEPGATFLEDLATLDDEGETRLHYRRMGAFAATIIIDRLKDMKRPELAELITEIVTR